MEVGERGGAEEGYVHEGVGEEGGEEGGCFFEGVLVYNLLLQLLLCFYYVGSCLAHLSSFDAFFDFLFQLKNIFFGFQPCLS